MDDRIGVINDRILEILLNKNSDNEYNRLEVLTKLETSEAFRLELIDTCKTIVHTVREWDIRNRLKFVIKLNSNQYVEARFISYYMLIDDLELFKSLSKNDLIKLKNNIETIYFTDFYAKSILLKALKLELVDFNFIINLAAGNNNIDKRIALVTIENYFITENNKEKYISFIIRVLSLTKECENIHVTDSHNSLERKANLFYLDS
jgi:hypothetical protein